MKKKPVAVVMTDTHMSDKNISLVKDIFKQTFEYCKANGIKRIFHGGDWFTSRTGQSIACLLSTKEILEIMHKEYGIEMTAIAGNHDKADQSLVESFLTVFENKPGFTLISLAGGIPFPFPKEGVYIGMIPYFTKESYELELLEFTDYLFDSPMKDIGHYILITHAAINGVKNNDGSEVTTGQSPKAFERWDKVLVGHYHNASKIGKNVHYIGSAYQANFGEDDKKGITVIYNDGSIEQVKLKFPEFVKFSVNAKSITGADIKDIENIRKEHPERHIRIVLTGTEEEVNSFDKSILESIGVSVDKKPTDVGALEPEEEIEIISYNKDNITEVFEEFCESRAISEYQYGLDLLKKL